MFSEVCKNNPCWCVSRKWREMKGETGQTDHPSPITHWGPGHQTTLFIWLRKFDLIACRTLQALLLVLLLNSSVASFFCSLVRHLSHPTISLTFKWRSAHTKHIFSESFFKLFALKETGRWTQHVVISPSLNLINSKPQSLRELFCLFPHFVRNCGYEI